MFDTKVDDKDSQCCGSGSHCCGPDHIDVDPDPAFHLMRIRILPFTLIRIRILPFNPDSKNHLYPDFDPSLIQNDPLRLPPFHFDADSDPAFPFDADTDPAFHYDADPDPASQNDDDSLP
jgi:hypothetical protein